MCTVAFCMSAHAADVRLIADRADKDLAVEMAIKTFEEVWLSRIFCVCPQRQNFMMGNKVRLSMFTVRICPLAYKGYG